MTYEYNHAAQRIAVKRLADRVGVVTTRKGTKRTVLLGLNDVRVAILNRCYGPGLGTIQKASIADIDKWLSDMVSVHRGELGPVLQEAQSVMAKANAARWEAVQLWECYGRWSERTRKSKRGIELLDKIRDTQGVAMQYTAEANKLLDHWEKVAGNSSAVEKLGDAVKQVSEARKRAESERKRLAREALGLKANGTPR